MNWRLLPFLAGALIAVAFSAATDAQQAAPTAGQAQGSQPQPAPGAQDVGRDQRGTDAAPVVVKLLNSGKSEAEAAAEAERVQEKAAEDRWATNWTLGFAGALVLATLLQFLALLWQGRELRKTLRATQRLADATLLHAKALIAIERPALAVAKLELKRLADPMGPSGEPITTGVLPDLSRVVITFKNVGRTPATIRKLALNWRVLRDLPATPAYDHPSDIDSIIQADGTLEYTPMNRPLMLSQEHKGSLSGFSAYLWVYGFVSFEDFLEEATTLGFVFSWGPLGPLGVDNPHGFAVDSDAPAAYSYYRKETAKQS